MCGIEGSRRLLACWKEGSAVRKSTPLIERAWVMGWRAVVMFQLGKRWSEHLRKASSISVGWSYVGVEGRGLMRFSWVAQMDCGIERRCVRSVLLVDFRSVCWGIGPGGVLVVVGGGSGRGEDGRRCWCWSFDGVEVYHSVVFDDQVGGCALDGWEEGGGVKHDGPPSE